MSSESMASTEPPNSNRSSGAAGPNDRVEIPGRGIGEITTITSRPRSPGAPEPNEIRSDRAAAVTERREFHDFEVLRVLGAGSFGTVYLARQISLDRHVALKVSVNRGHEARTLASLEHDHIVHVFSESIDIECNQRVLCMQYVPGTTLEKIITALDGRARKEWSGRSLLQAIDSLSQHPAAFHPAALRDREILAGSNFYQAVCWIGARLAEALDYAHSQGVLHRDIKPANILVSQYGRPLLADFNISAQTTSPPSEDMFGGTLGYMAPEHLDAFDRHSGTTQQAVDERSDLYSLGVVLFELLTGSRPFDRPRSTGGSATIRELAQHRRSDIPVPSDKCPDVPGVLDYVVARCLDPNPKARYQTGADLSRALEGCREFVGAELSMPPAGPLAMAALNKPFLVTAFVALLPHVLGSIVNISYNTIQIVDRLSAGQRMAFDRLVLAYNVLVYPLCIALLGIAAAPAFRLRRQWMSRWRGIESEQIDRIRHRVLHWPIWVVGLSCLGWLPGGIVFPLGIGVLAERAGADVFSHFLVSFAISGLIALTYSFFGVQYVVLRVCYSKLWGDVQNFRERARQELARVAPRLRFFQILAGAIPLAGAILMVSVEPEVSAYRTFRVLVTGLIGLGMAGFILAAHATNRIVATMAAFTGSDSAAYTGNN